MSNFNTKREQAEQLLQLKDKIQRLEREEAKLDGAIAELERNLLEEFKVKTLAEAEDLLTDMRAEGKKLEEKLAGYIEKLEELLDVAE